MMKKSLVKLCAVIAIGVLLCGCGKSEVGTNVAPDADATSDTSAVRVELSEDVKSALDDLYAVQNNYSNGTATLNIIPTVTVETVYDNWDSIVASGIDTAPIMLREYVDPSVVYLDYASDFSIKWLKDENDVQVEATDVAAREDYKQKQHK